MPDCNKLWPDLTVNLLLPGIVEQDSAPFLKYLRVVFLLIKFFCVLAGSGICNVTTSAWLQQIL